MPFAPIALSMSLALTALLPSAAAYETDQITDRLLPLRDAGVEADGEVARRLSAAIQRTNQQTGCRATTEVTRRTLAEKIYDQMAFPTYVKGRGELAGLGYGAYAAWLETSPSVDRRSVEYYGDIYARTRPQDSLVLSTVGVCSTILLAGRLMGTDKPDHFWAQGYEYLLASHHGLNDDDAIAWGDASEKGAYGFATSGVYSYADLAANWEGYQFYKALLTDDSPLERGGDGCVVLARPFRWADWITDALDEVLNPPQYVERVETAVRAQLAGERTTLCAAYKVWGRTAEAQRAKVIVAEAPHLSPLAPPREDEWQLDALCAS